MTAVASPPSFQPLPQWNTNNGGQKGLDSMSADDVTRMFMNRKSVQRTNSSSSLASSFSGSSTYTIPAAASQTNLEASATNGDQGVWVPRKKIAKGIWPSSKPEAVSGISTTRPMPIPTSSSGQSAASNISAMHQPSPVVPSTNRIQSQPQQNGGRMETSTNQTEPSVVLILLPMTGTFERKHIAVPYFPEVLRIGRQTNAKTVPTPINGYFDSKVLSRQHAEVWADRTGKVWIRDVKSSNGTFVNGVRLSPENRDSEPHELREHDTLELGIDIVSEDQKSIVHHKVSAKVEHAGIYGNNPIALDLNFGDVDPNTGNGVIGSSIGQPISQIRGRGGGQGLVGSNGRLSAPPSMINGSLNPIGPQRQMNLWMNPITIEQVVKKLTMELKQAKQQSQDLHRTSDFFSNLLTSESDAEPPKPSCDIAIGASQPKVSSPGAQLDAISPFSHPPVPPPQQPLPEKPDITRFGISGSFPQNSLKRTDTGRSGSIGNSPVKSDPSSSQILSLIEALTTAKREIDSQGDRMKHLESLLEKERKARESAEERARHLLESKTTQETRQANSGDEAIERPFGSPTKMELLVNGEDTHQERKPSLQSLVTSDYSLDRTKNLEKPYCNAEPTNVEESRLQERLKLMAQEMDDMKALMESYKHRAEGAERERKSLAEIVERIRSENSSKSQVSNASLMDKQRSYSPSSTISHSSMPESSLDLKFSKSKASVATSSVTEGEPDEVLPGGENIVHDVKNHDQQQTPAPMLKKQRERWGEGGGDVVLQSAPYMSMVGIVLIGVGLMSWLNGWQKGER